jgi:hypothetical protein
MSAVKPSPASTMLSSRTVLTDELATKKSAPKNSPKGTLSYSGTLPPAALGKYTLPSSRSALDAAGPSSGSLAAVQAAMNQSLARSVSGGPTPTASGPMVDPAVLPVPGLGAAGALSSDPKVAKLQAQMMSDQEALAGDQAYCKQAFADIAAGKTTTPAAKLVTRYFGNFKGKSPAVDAANAKYKTSPTKANLMSLAKTIQPTYVQNSSELIKYRNRVLAGNQAILAALGGTVKANVPAKSAAATTSATATTAAAAPSTGLAAAVMDGIVYNPQVNHSANQADAYNVAMHSVVYSNTVLNNAKDFVAKGFSDIYAASQSSVNAQYVLQNLQNYTSQSPAIKALYDTYTASADSNSQKNLTALAHAVEPLFAATDPLISKLQANMDKAQVYAALFNK